MLRDFFADNNRKNRNNFFFHLFRSFYFVAVNWFVVNLFGNGGVQIIGAIVASPASTAAPQISRREKGIVAQANQIAEEYCGRVQGIACRRYRIHKAAGQTIREIRK